MIPYQLKTQEEKATRLRGQIGSVDYNHSLLDRLWILCAFPSVLNEFQQKCSALSREKRRLERDFDKQQAAALAKLETIKEVQGALINGAAELPLMKHRMLSVNWPKALRLLSLPRLHLLSVRFQKPSSLLRKLIRKGCFMLLRMSRMYS